MKRFLLIFIFVAMPCFAFCQTSIFSDGTGQSAFKISGTAITANTKDESLDIAFDVLKRKKVKRVGSYDFFKRWAVDLNLTATKGISSIKSSDGFPINANLGIYRGWKKSPGLIAGNDMRETYISINVLSESDQLYDLTKATADASYAKTYPGWKAAIGRFGYCKNTLWGMELNFGQATNASQLTQATVSTLQNSSATDSVKVFKEQLAYSSSEFRSGQFNVHVNADLAFLLNSSEIVDTTKKILPIFLGLHFRYVGYQLSKPQFNPAIGVYFGKIGAPRNVNLGVNMQFVDLTNALNAKSSNAWKRSTLGLTAGYQLK